MKRSGIYVITAPGFKFYVGRSIDLRKREGDYEDMEHNGSTGQPLISKSIRDHGWAAHSFDVEFECEPDDNPKRETELYWKFRHLLGEGAMLNAVVPNSHQRTSRISLEERIAERRKAIATKRVKKVKAEKIIKELKLKKVTTPNDTSAKKIRRPRVDWEMERIIMFMMNL